MATRVRIITDESTFVHFEKGLGVDYTLCGLECSEMGDDEVGIGGATRTNRRVDCPDCLSIVTFCKSIKSTEYKH